MPEAGSDSQAAAAPQGGARILVHIPIIHSQAELGSQHQQIRRAYVEKIGEQAWQDSRRAIGAFWAALEQKILSLDLDWRRVRLYQDALPVCGHEAEIVRDLAATGAANYRILQALMARGAHLEGTESAELLLREKDLLTATGPDAAAGAEPQARNQAAAALLLARDRFIAARIDATLQPGEIGLLFLGALHRAPELLPANIARLELEQFAARQCRG